MSRRITQKLRCVTAPIAQTEQNKAFFADTAPRLRAMKKHRDDPRYTTMFYASVAIAIAGMVALLGFHDATWAAICFMLSMVWALLWLLWVVVVEISQPC
jgi:hypothetical protein